MKVWQTWGSVSDETLLHGPFFLHTAIGPIERPGIFLFKTLSIYESSTPMA